MPIATILATIFAFLLVVLVHEFGHFAVAKLVGIKVHEFSIGMGPKLFSRKNGETQYSLRALPIGGYVKMEGEDEDSKDPKSFSNKSIPARMAVLVAGAFMNFVLAIVIFIMLSYSSGVPTTIIDKVQDNTPAKTAGLEAGDKIVSINGVETKEWEDVLQIVGKNKNKPMDITVLRNGVEIKKELTPIYNEEGKKYIIGILSRQEKSLVKATKQGFKDTFTMLGKMFDFFGRLVRGNVKSNEVSGPVGIINTIGKAANHSFMAVLLITGIISVNLGFFNLLPIPALDGGRLIFLIIEAVRGKPINPEKEGIVHFIGFVLLIILMLAVTYKDVIYLWIK
ncbi:RIP metalloprotease RseP [Clostridiaceae bacterium M8S5]|nr:RIP metalloprotease RseP [Clostridiaceae bacterium M8S5]